MAKRQTSNSIPRLHNLRRKIAEEIFFLVYTKEDKNFRKAKIEEIESWIAEMGYLGNETPSELAREWQENTKQV
jgi:hypothetical protein